VAVKNDFASDTVTLSEIQQPNTNTKNLLTVLVDKRECIFSEKSLPRKYSSKPQFYKGFSTHRFQFLGNGSEHTIYGVRIFLTTMPKYCATCLLVDQEPPKVGGKNCFHQFIHRFCGKWFLQLARILPMERKPQYEFQISSLQAIT